jgi:hypothetical protein
MVEEAAASSTPQATNLPAPGAAAAVHSARQHTPAQTSRASRAVPGALSAARELLCHPPSSTASLGAMKQWRDDVDRLLGMAHSSSTRPRPWSSRRQHEASTSVRSPSVRAALTRICGRSSTVGVRERTLQPLWRGLMTCGQNSTAGVRARVPASLWRGRVSTDKMSRVATSTMTSLRLHHRLQRASGFRWVSPWPAWAAPHWRIISTQRLGHPSSDCTCPRSTTVRQIRRNSCRFMSPPSRQQVETPP